MSHVTTATLATSDAGSVPPTVARARRKNAPVLFTENVFSTAAAAPVGLGLRLWLHTTLMVGLGRIRTALTQPRPCQPRRELAYFERARMSRAMDRL